MSQTHATMWVLKALVLFRRYLNDMKKYRRCNSNNNMNCASNRSKTNLYNLFLIASPISMVGSEISSARRFSTHIDNKKAIFDKRYCLDTGTFVKRNS